MVSKKIEKLEPYRSKQDKKSKRSEVPSTRQEAKRELKCRLDVFRRDVEESEAQREGGMTDTETSGTDRGNWEQ